MPPEVVSPKKKLPIAQLAVLAVLAVAVAMLILWRVDVGGLIERGIDILRGLGAGIYFLAMTILPAFGVPLMFFTIPAGQTFAPQLTMGGVIAISLVVIAVNLALGYWVARYAMRPLLEGLVKRYGYSVPRVTKDNALTVALIARLTPGPPYVLQTYILGMAEVPFKTYMIVSWLSLLPLVIGCIVLGQGLFSGKIWTAVTGLGVLIVASIAVQLIRRRYFSKRDARVAQSQTS